MSAGTAYAKRYAGGFVDKPTLTTPIDSVFLNAVEAALLQLLGAAPSADAQVMQWDNANTRYGPALLLNKNIDPAAAIAKSKLDLTGANGIVNADIAAAAAIARSKLDFGAGLVNSDISAVAAIAASKLAGYPSSAAKALLGDGSWGSVNPFPELDFVTVTDGVAHSSAATSFAAATAFITGNTITLDGATRVKIEFFAPSVWSTGGAAFMNFRLEDAGTETAWIAERASAGAEAFPGSSVYGTWYTTPSAGSHTYKVRLTVNANTGNVEGNNGGGANPVPIYLRVSKAPST